MKQILLVGVGGAIGAVARFKLAAWVLHHHASDWRFPLGTFTVNVLGCAVAGILAALVERYHLFSPDTRLLLFTGILGGFTTFSAFGIDTIFLLWRGETFVALGYVLLSVLCCLAGLWLGMSLIAPAKAS